MTDKLTFSFKGPVTVRIGNAVVDLEKQATEFDYASRAAGKSDSLKGFDAGNGTFFRLKKKPDGAVDVVIYGKPEELAKYRFKVSNGDLTKARFAGGGDFRSTAPQARNFLIGSGELDSAVRDQLLKRFHLAHDARVPQTGALPVKTAVQGSRPAILDIDVPEVKPSRRALPAVGFTQLGNTCYLNSTLKTLFASRGAATLDALRVQAGKPPFTIELDGRRPLDEIRIELLALAEASTDPGKQTLVNASLKRLVALLNAPTLSVLAARASDELKTLTTRLGKPLTNLEAAEHRLEVARAAQRLALENSPYHAVLKSAFPDVPPGNAAVQAQAYPSVAELDALVSESEAALPALRQAHADAVLVLDQEAVHAGWESFSDQKEALTSIALSSRFAGKIHKEQDAPEFAGWLRGIMRLACPDERRFVLRTEIENHWHEKSFSASKRPPEEVLQLTPPSDLSDTTFSALIRDHLRPEALSDFAAGGGDVRLRSVIQADVGNLKHFAIRIDAQTALGEPVALTGINFDDEVVVPISDSASGAQMNVVMRPVEIIFHERLSSAAAHYYTYLRDENGWLKHDDADISRQSAPPALRPGLQPRVVVMEVLRTEPAV